MALLATYPVKLSELHERYVALGILLPDFVDLHLVKLDKVMLLALRIRKPMDRMDDVFLMCNPLKIAYMIIRRVVVNMVDLMLFGGWLANESDRHKAVHKNSFFVPGSGKLNSAVAVFAFVWNHDQVPSCATQTSANAFYSTMIGNVIRRFVARNGLPNFFHYQPLLVGSSVMRMRGSWHRNQFSGATLAAQGKY